MSGASHWTRRLKIVAASLGGLALLVAAAGGFLHTAAGRPLLATLSGHHCPFGRGVLEPAQRDALRRQGLGAQPHSNARAAAHPALGFELGQMNHDSVLARATSRGETCKSESKGAGLACHDDAAQTNRYFRFNASGTLVGVLSVQRTTDAARAAAMASENEAKLSAAIGAPSTRAGEASATYLASGPLRQSRFEHRFTDFAAIASATNLGGGAGYLVTEEAQLVD